eukprot:PLAT6048.1.p1 GENE.PLAT6048.1~~PLAT6048.1.p1  ORF type:complete len:366 (-),score=131.71 PLAT6048.1:227-1324(-)
MASPVSPDVELATERPPDGVVAGDSGGSGGQSGGDSEYNAGIKLLTGLEQHCRRRLPLSCLIMSFNRCFCVLQTVPLFYQYSGSHAWLSAVCWSAPHLLFVPIYIILARANCKAAVAQVVKSRAAVLAAPRAFQSLRKELSAILVAVIPLIIVYWLGIAAPSGAPLAWKLIAVFSLISSLVTSPLVWRALILQQFFVQLVGVSTKALRETVRVDADVAQLKADLRRLGKLYDSCWPYALLTVLEAVGTLMTAFVLVFPTLTIRPLNGAFLFMLVMNVLGALVTRLPSADVMTQLESLPQLISRRMLFQPGLTVEREREVQRLLDAMQSARYGWFIGNLPLTSSLLARTRAIVVPLAVVAFRELLF